MIGGILSDSGYYMGDNLYPARDSNPKGFFENQQINGINEDILRYYDSKLDRFKYFFTRKRTIHAPGYGQRWLMSIDGKDAVSYDNAHIIQRIDAAVNLEGAFAYKDPRFSYTLPVWEKRLSSDVGYVVVFREPGTTAYSIIKECSDVDYLRNLSINDVLAYQVWFNIYTHVLQHYRRNPDRFFFINYDQVLDNKSIERLEDFLGADIKTDFVERRFMRSKAIGDPPDNVKQLYAELCNLSLR